MFVPAGYVKLNGATVNRSNYPRLVALADAHSLWTADTAANPGLFGNGNGSTTMVLPNWTGRMAQFAATAGGAVAEGLPNITGILGAAVYKDAGGNVNYSGIVKSVSRLSINYISPSGTSNIPPNATFFSSNVEYSSSNSNSIYGASTTVQPPAINTFAIMRY